MFLRTAVFKDTTAIRTRRTDLLTLLTAALQAKTKSLFSSARALESRTKMLTSPTGLYWARVDVRTVPTKMLDRRMPILFACPTLVPWATGMLSIRASASSSGAAGSRPLFGLPQPSPNPLRILSESSLTLSGVA